MLCNAVALLFTPFWSQRIMFDIHQSLDNLSLTMTVKVIPSIMFCNQFLMQQQIYENKYTCVCCKAVDRQYKKLYAGKRGETGRERLHNLVLVKYGTKKNLRAVLFEVVNSTLNNYTVAFIKLNQSILWKRPKMAIILIGYYNNYPFHEDIWYLFYSKTIFLISISVSCNIFEEITVSVYEYFVIWGFVPKGRNGALLMRQRCPVTLLSPFWIWTINTLKFS